MTPAEPEIRDGYLEFFAKFDRVAFFEFGLDRLIFPEVASAEHAWNSLKERIAVRSANLHVRNFGRNGGKNAILTVMYRELFGIEIVFDPTNNSMPTRTLQALTGHRKNKTIRNYQVSHVFGNTKNVYAFTAPWNLVFVPKILDPFTGHEATGPAVKEFTSRFQSLACQRFESLILDFNAIMDSQRPETENWLEHNVKDAMIREAISKEFRSIETSRFPTAA